MNDPTPAMMQEEIIDYYDTCEIDYKLVWHLDSHLAMHYGYWNKHTRTLREALLNMNELVADKGGIKDRLKVLDAGCGVGGTAIYLAQKFNSHFYGISLSNQQIKSARHHASKRKLIGKTSFAERDFTNTGFPDNNFDVVYAVESVCHALEKKDFLGEAYRVLRPGGTLVVLDFYRNRKKYDLEQDELIKKWANTWAVRDFEYIDDFVIKASQVGFKIIENQDITTHIVKSARRLYWCFYPGWLVHHVLQWMRKRNNTQKKNLWSTFYQYKALMKGLWSYHLVCCTKPVNNE